jgi:hypothetical protein
MSRDIDKMIQGLSKEEKDKLVQAITDSKNVDQEDEDENEVYVDDTFAVKNRTPKSQGRTQVRGGKNKWVDEGENKNIETPDFEKTPRRRSAASKVKVECHVCGKFFKSDPRYLYGEFHRCNKCIGR